MGSAQARTEFVDNIFKMNRVDPRTDKLVLRHVW